MRLRISLATALTLVVGFAVASLTGNRGLGGVVLVLGGALCAWWMWRTAGAARTVVTLVAALGLFVVSHPLGTVIGALIFGTLSNGMNLMGVNSNWQLIVTGQILLGASMLDAVSSRKR